MKKLLTIAFALVMALSMTVTAFAAEEIEIALVPESFGANTMQASDVVVWGENSVTANALGQFSLTLPTTCYDGDTVVLHVKGTSESDFRMWLLAGNAVTASNQWKATDNGYAGTGDFEFYVELTCQYHDADFESAEDINFKAPSWDAQLTNFTLTYVGIMYGTIADMDAAALAEVQSYVDAAEDAIAKGDADAAIAAIDVIAAKGDLGFASCTAKAKELMDKVEGIYDAELLASLQEYVDKVNNALETAKNANNDVAVMTAAYEEAVAAADYVTEQGKGYKMTTEKAKELKVVAKEIKDLIAEAEEANAKAEAERIAAEEAAAAKAKTTTIVIIAAVAVVVVVVAVVLVVLKKKKK